MPEQDNLREQDVLSLCEKVRNISAVYNYNPNGPDTSSCPFCHESVYDDFGDMSEITHKQNCAYLLAKDLSTNLV
jgi:hypothetical protein